MRSLRAWLDTSGIADGPIFRKVKHAGTIGGNRLNPNAVRQILSRRAAAAGVSGTLMEPVTPHGMRAGFVTLPTPTASPMRKSWATRATRA